MPTSAIRPAPAQRQRGAVLLALLLLLLVGAGSLLLSVARPVNSDREQCTLRDLAAAREALLGFALQNGRLPRPATVATNGDEQAATCDTDASCTGLLPWRTLGLPAGDAWGNLLHYSVTPAYATAPVDRENATATKTVVVRVAEGWRYLGGGPQCRLDLQCVPAVIFSSGTRQLAISLAGIVRAADSGVSTGDDAANAVASARFIRALPAADRFAPGTDDDLVEYIPLQLLLQRLSAIDHQRR